VLNHVSFAKGFIICIRTVGCSVDNQPGAAASIFVIAKRPERRGVTCKLYKRYRREAMYIAAHRPELTANDIIRAPKLMDSLDSLKVMVIDDRVRRSAEPPKAWLEKKAANRHHRGWFRGDGNGAITADVLIGGQRAVIPALERVECLP
jgi:hypothetical protein